MSQNNKRTSLFDYLSQALDEVFQEEAFINLVITKYVERLKEDHDKKLFTRFLYGVVEHKLELDYLLSPYTKGKRIKPWLKNILRLGVYGETYLNIANHYLVNELVETTKKKDFSATRFVNGIMRSFDRGEKLSVDGLSPTKKKSIIYSMPEELVTLIEKEYPDKVDSILDFRKESINTYRIHELKTTKEEVIEYCTSKNISYEIKNHALLTKVSLLDTPLFQEGKIVPMDLSSMQVCETLNPNECDTILDCCSAPGSKAFYLADLMKDKGKILAGDLYKARVELIDEMSKKLGITSIHTMVSDATNATYETRFDKILMDVPCSGLGVMKHKPDLKYRMTLEKIKEIVQVQKAILEHVSTFLKVGGEMVYSTCTITKEENENQIQLFLEHHPEFEKISEVQILPEEAFDGFYICKMKKVK